jgi:cytoskeletal protein CcmA (bactofilin family)
MTMFKKYQHSSITNRDTPLSTTSKLENGTIGLSAAPKAIRPFVKEPIQIEPPPRIFDSSTMTTPSLPNPTNKLVEAPTWTEPVSLDSEEPETTLGEGVTFKGELSFQRLLRIDGHFEGKLTSTGKLFVGPNGVLKSDDIQLREAIIEGKVEGNIKVEERIELRGDAIIRGNIEARTLSVDEGVSITGHVKVLPQKEAEQEEP